MNGMKTTGAGIDIITRDMGAYTATHAMFEYGQYSFHLSFIHRGGNVEGFACSTCNIEYRDEEKAMTTHNAFTRDVTDDDGTKRRDGWEEVDSMMGALVNAPSTVTKDDLLDCLASIDPNEHANLCIEGRDD